MIASQSPPGPRGLYIESTLFPASHKHQMLQPLCRPRDPPGDTQRNHVAPHQASLCEPMVALLQAGRSFESLHRRDRYGTQSKWLHRRRLSLESVRLSLRQQKPGSGPARNETNHQYRALRLHELLLLQSHAPFRDIRRCHECRARRCLWRVTPWHPSLSTVGRLDRAVQAACRTRTASVAAATSTGSVWLRFSTSLLKQSETRPESSTFVSHSRWTGNASSPWVIH